MRRLTFAILNTADVTVKKVCLVHVLLSFSSVSRVVSVAASNTSFCERQKLNIPCSVIDDLNK